MFEILRKMWQANRITQVQLTNAVKRGWITEEELDTILNTAK